MDLVNIAFIGCGSMAGAHLKGFLALRERGFMDFRIRAFCDTKLEKANAMAAQYEEGTGEKAAVFRHFVDLLEAESALDGVCIFTPHDSHHTIAMACIDAGKHVMTEKPIALTIRAGRQMIAAAKEKGVVLHVAENYRLAPAERAASWAICSGMIGTPRLLTWMDVGLRNWHWGWRDHKEVAGGGWTLDGGIHFADLWQVSLGPVQRVSATAAAFDPIRFVQYKSMDDYQSRQEEMAKFRKSRSLKQIDPQSLREPIASNLEDTTAAVLDFANGVIGTWVVSRAAPAKVDRSCALYGSEAALVWGDGLYRTGQEDVAVSWQDLRQQYLDNLSTGERERFFPFGLTDSVAIEDKQYIDGILGRYPVEVDGSIGLQALAVPMAVYESAVLQRPVVVEDVLNLKVETYQGELNQMAGIE